MGTRPDLTFTHSWLSSGNQQRTLQFDQEAERTLRYMRDTQYIGLMYHGGEEALVLRGYCDAGVTLYEQCTTGCVTLPSVAQQSLRDRTVRLLPVARLRQPN